MSAGQAYLFEQEDVISDVTTLDAIFTKAGNRILAVGVHVWLMRLVASGRVRFDMRELAKEVREGRPALTECMSVLVELGLVARVRFQGQSGRWVTDTVVFQRPCTAEQLARLAHVPSYRGPAVIEIYGSDHKCQELREAFPIISRGTGCAPATRNLVAGANRQNSSVVQPTPTTRNLVAGATGEDEHFPQLTPTTSSPTAGELVAHKELRTDTDLSSIDRANDVAAREPSTAARALVLDLNYGSHTRPSAADIDLLAGLVDDATTEHGLTLAELRRHAQAALNRVRSPDVGGRPVPYLAGALEPARLPAPRVRSPRRSVVAIPVDAHAEDSRKTAEGPTMTRAEAVDFVRANTKASSVPLSRRQRAARRRQSESG